jgi:hypothetical protein
MGQMSFALDPASLLSFVRLVGWKGLERDLYIYRSCSCAKKIAAASSNGKCGIFALGGKDHETSSTRSLDTVLCCYLPQGMSDLHLNDFIHGILGSRQLPYQWS